MKILMLHGINLNMFGKRDPQQYGTITLAEIDAGLAALGQTWAPVSRASKPITKARCASASIRPMRCSSTRRLSSPRPKTLPAPTCCSSSRTSSTRSSNAPPSPTVSCACAAATTATTSWSPLVASGAAFARRAGPGAWRRRRRTWSITAQALPPGRSPGTNSPLDCLCPGSLPHVPVRQRALSLPIPLRLLLAAQPKLLRPVLQVVHRAITLPAGAGRSQGQRGRRGRQRRGHSDSALWLGRQLEHSPSLPGPGRRVPARH